MSRFRKAWTSDLAKNTPSIDLLKGLLILLVMGGHVMEITHVSNSAFWIGSGFRMPLMVGISGYLLNVARTREDAPGTLLFRYGRRMLLPWAVATSIYVTVSHVPLSWTAPVDLFLRPVFHLWYIPALFCFILSTRLLPFSPLTLLALSAPVSLAAMYGFGLGHAAVGQGLFAPDSRFLYYPVYFFFGMWMAARPLSRQHIWMASIAAGLGLVWWAALYGSGDQLAYVPARLLMCIGLIALLRNWTEWRWRFPAVEAIGRGSLFFYLWHPLVMSLAIFAGCNALTTLALAILLLAMAHVATGRSPLLALLLGARERSSVKASRQISKLQPADA